MRLRIPRRLRGPAVAAVLVMVAAAVGLSPRALREVESFRVRRVEVIGTRFMDPYTVLQAAALARGSSVFDDADAWRAGVMTLPMVAGVEIRRKLPGTIQVTVAEVEPVALVAGETLRAVDASGSLIPLELAGAALDLPILAGVELREGRIGADPGALAALDALVVLARDAPELAGRISQIERRSGLLRVVFRDGSAEALLPLDASAVEFRQLRLAYADLVSRGELRNVRRIDLRFRDQVVVSFLSSPVS